jgi:hypothetical protein
MTRKLHDAFAKEWLQELLADFGTVAVEQPIAGEVRTVDIVFHPHPEAVPNLPALGLLGRMVATPCLLEPFRNPVPSWEICNCRHKLFDVLLAQRRQAHQKGRSRADRPVLWILSPTMSGAIQRSFRVVEKPTWGPGIYFLPDPDRTAVVALHHLPRTLDTLWLRLFARGQVQAAAVAEVVALPVDHPYRQQTLYHLAVLQVNLKIRQNQSQDLQEVMMSLSPAYEKWEQETLAKGRQEGQLEIVRRMLQGDLPLETIAQVTGWSIEQLQRLQADQPQKVFEK